MQERVCVCVVNVLIHVCLSFVHVPLRPLTVLLEQSRVKGPAPDKGRGARVTGESSTRIPTTGTWTKDTQLH